MPGRVPNLHCSPVHRGSFPNQRLPWIGVGFEFLLRGGCPGSVAIGGDHDGYPLGCGWISRPNFTPRLIGLNGGATNWVLTARFGSCLTPVRSPINRNQGKIFLKARGWAACSIMETETGTSNGGGDEVKTGWVGWILRGNDAQGVEGTYPGWLRRLWFGPLI